MQKGNPRQGHVAVAIPGKQERRRPIVRAGARMLQVKQANDLCFFTVQSTSSPPHPFDDIVFHEGSRGEAPYQQAKATVRLLRSLES